MSDLPLLRTPVEVGAPPRLIALGDRNVFLGSCFAEHIGCRFAESGLRTVVNPLGVMYSPGSIGRLMGTEKSNAATDFAEGEGLWHTWLGDSTLSRPTKVDCQRVADAALVGLHEALREADNLWLTLGTDHYYTLQGEERPVANCHKMGREMFVEHTPTVADTTEMLDQWLTALKRRNPRLQVLMTVSPFRYRKYGFHESQLSKARLLLAAEELCTRYPSWVAYFPAYEVVMDELRDYRFYAEDMLHPSDEAVGYIWQRLRAAWLTPEARDYLVRWDSVYRAMQHRPLHPESAVYEQFRQRTAEQLRQLQADYPMLFITGNE